MIGILVNKSIAISQSSIVSCFVNSLIEIFDEKIFLIDVNKSDKLSNIINNRRLDCIKITSTNSWENYENEVEEKLKDIDLLIVFSSNILNQYKVDNYGLLNYYEKTYKNNDAIGFNYNSVSKILRLYSIIKTQAKSKNLVHFIIDPQEPCLCSYVGSGKTRYILNNKEFGYEYIPCYEYELFKNKPRGLVDDIKLYDFVFYCTAITEDRKHIIGFEDLFNNNDCRSDVKIITDMKNSAGKLISQDEYYNKLKLSKFTLLIPSYDVNTFSVIRFFEALANNCVPLVLESCCLDDLQITFPDIYDIVNDYLLTNYDNIVEKVKNTDYLLMLNKLLNTQSIKNFRNIDYFRSYWISCREVN